MKDLIKIILWAIFIFLAIVGILALCAYFFPDLEAKEISQQGYASYYTMESCLREGTSGIMANGEVFDENALTCASRDYRFGTILQVTNLANGKIIQVMVCDRGPAKSLVRKGRIIDLSREAFRRIAKLEKGIIKVKIERIK